MVRFGSVFGLVRFSSAEQLKNPGSIVHYTPVIRHRHRQSPLSVPYCIHVFVVLVHEMVHLPTSVCGDGGLY